MILEKSCAGLFVVVVRITGAGTGAGFDHDLMAALDELINSRRKQPDAIFLIFDLFRNTDDHGARIRPNQTQGNEISGKNHSRAVAQGSKVRLDFPGSPTVVENDGASLHIV